MSLTIRGPHDQPITSIDEWHDAMPARVRNHWRAERSARELAQSWFRGGADSPAIPAELAAVLDTCDETRGFNPELVYPERVTHLDTYRGGQRNHDVIIVGSAAAGKILVAIEAKADEPLGPTLADQIRRPPVASHKPDRLDALCCALLSRPYSQDLSGLRYQLFTAAVGTAMAAADESADIAVLVVQIFKPTTLSPNSAEKRAPNDRDIDAFLRALGIAPGPTGTLAGPVKVDAGRSAATTIPLLVGHVESSVAGP